MRLSLLFVVALLASACDRGSSSGSSGATGATTAAAATTTTTSGAGVGMACTRIQTTWAFDGFIGVSPAGSASAAALNAQNNEGVQTIRITYTGTQIKMKAGSQISSSSYVVVQDSASSCKMRNGN